MRNILAIILAGVFACLGGCTAARAAQNPEWLPDMIAPQAQQVLLQRSHEHQQLSAWGEEVDGQLFGFARKTVGDHEIKQRRFVQQLATRAALLMVVYDHFEHERYANEQALWLTVMQLQFASHLQAKIGAGLQVRTTVVDQSVISLVWFPRSSLEVGRITVPAVDEMDPIYIKELLTMLGRCDRSSDWAGIIQIVSQLEQFRLLLPDEQFLKDVAELSQGKANAMGGAPVIARIKANPSNYTSSQIERVADVALAGGADSIAEQLYLIAIERFRSE